MKRQSTTALAFAAALAAGFVAATEAAAQPAMTMPPPLPEIVFVCPLDRSIRSLTPGECRRRARRADLVAEVPEPREFPVELTTAPSQLATNEPARLRFRVLDPWERKVVRRFVEVHESLFHLFVVSEDLEYFRHEHPRWDGDAFELIVNLPKAGHYRLLADFLPEAATPQLAIESLVVPGPPPAPAPLARDYSPKRAANLDVQITVTPDEPVAGTAAKLELQLSPGTGIEPYLGAPGHMLVASDDLIELMHAHPLNMQAGPSAEFSVVFPRARVYRVWVQFQREGVVNTARFDVPVRSAAP